MKNMFMFTIFPLLIFAINLFIFISSKHRIHHSAIRKIAQKILYCFFANYKETKL